MTPRLKSTTTTLPVHAETIHIYGTVQGVGFRPFVWRLACEHQLTGQVWNDAEGVVVQVWGDAASLQAFRDQLQTDIPPLAQIDSIQVTSLLASTTPAEFSIVHSQTGKPLTNVSPDAATCPACLAEISDPTNRRYRYAFTNCTHCGPRFSIIRRIPYDRANTSMHAFSMCPECQAEYDDPSDRRFHAQPNACKTCGPSVWLESSTGERITNTDFVDVIAYAAHLIRQGHILAVKGMGGFHLVCDASNAQAVTVLRQRKQRDHKPFALMARDVAVMQRYAFISHEEQVLLQNSAAPIVLLAKRNAKSLPPELAPGQNQLGFMLPYTPLHSLLLQDMDIPLVMTSGNRSDEAQCISNTQARTQLHAIADYFLLHDREIVNRLDDSVARVVNNQVQVLRRARGYAPRPLQLPPGFEQAPPILAMGAELKNTFCLLKEGKAILSQHQGDLEDASVFQDYRDNIDLYQELFDHKASSIAIDRHPEYISTKYGLQLAARDDIDVIPVQHHHAHVAACMAEHGLPLNSQAVLGIALDGLGYGDNGELWGGEFLLADYRSYKRLACFQPVAMPGASRAIIEPWRNAFAQLHQNLGWEQVTTQFPDLPFVEFMQAKPVENLLTMIDNGINSPSASSVGRLFDAVAALLGICVDAVSYEGEAAMQLEALAVSAYADSEPFSYSVKDVNPEKLVTVQWYEFWQEFLKASQQGTSPRIISARFHHTLVASIIAMVSRLAQRHAFHTVILSGGVMQNRLLAEQLRLGLSQRFEVMTASQIPANDGGIAFGQVAIAAAQAIAANK